MRVVVEGSGMKSEGRKAAITAFKERKVVGGVYLIRCEATGEAWVGQWPDISTIQTRLWFTLRQGTHPHKDLLDAWRKHGEAEFSFEILQKHNGDASPYILAAELKDMAAHWRVKLGANPI